MCSRTCILMHIFVRAPPRTFLSCDVNPDDDPENIYVGGHGHITDYKGKGEPGDDGYQHGQDRATRWGYWTKGGYEAVQDKEGTTQTWLCRRNFSTTTTTTSANPIEDATAEILVRIHRRQWLRNW